MPGALDTGSNPVISTHIIICMNFDLMQKGVGNLNKIKCLKCGQILHSKHRHDFVVCSCWDNKGNGCAVDGGDEYRRRVGKDYEEVE
jgi:hypothetical protein